MERLSGAKFGSARSVLNLVRLKGRIAAQNADPLPSVERQSASLNGEGSSLSEGIFEPSDSFAVRAIGQNKLLVVAIALLVGLLGAGTGYLREPTYTASASLQVGQVNPNSPGFLGYTNSAASLATAFSRSVGAAPVLATVECKLQLSRELAASRLTAEPIPQAPVFQVIATGPNERAAVKLANVAAGAVVVYESRSNSANPQARWLLGDYRRTSLALRRAVMRVAEVDASSAGSEELLRAEAAKSAAQVQLDATGKAYTEAVTSEAPRQGLVSFSRRRHYRKQQPPLHRTALRLLRPPRGSGTRLRSGGATRAAAPENAVGETDLKPRPRSSQPA